ncbi:hypothetical protein J5N97_024562 [Dioscorea zingiberensis]|uniref:Uncharacterized protein n=1 Tax=Dioscorea zingiberensis TaxID=325984 RepID=A0A9D5C7K5_9LILI|nr:hypothetical protein J5N97_024562 [Dioscorea zingiberensis]
MSASSQSGDKEEQSQSENDKELGGHVFSMSLDDIRAGHYTKLPLGPGTGSLFLPELPPEEDINIRLDLSKLMDGGVRIMTPLSEQLKRPLPKATVVLNLEDLSAGAQKQLPQGTPLGVNVDDDWEEDGLMVVHGIPDVQVVLPKFQLRTLEEEEVEHMINRLNDLTQHQVFKNLSVIPRIEFPENINKAVLQKFGEAVSPRIPSTGGVLLDAPGHISRDALAYVSLPTYYHFNKNMQKYVDNKKTLFDK